jgi:hypothetical protein
MPGDQHWLSTAKEVGTVCSEFSYPCDWHGKVPSFSGERPTIVGLTDVYTMNPDHRDCPSRVGTGEQEQTSGRLW